MKLLISGSSGAIGRALFPALAAAEHSVTRLKSGGAVSGADIHWNALGPLEAARVSGFDAVIHLAGENIAGRWSEKKKQAIYNTRVLGTRHLCEALARAAQPPRVLLAASAVGYYGAAASAGDAGEEYLTEDSPPGSDFLAHVTRDWEAATGAARQANIRVVNMRFGLVLSASGGALPKMLRPFRLGLGGPLGSGQQWFSWVAMDDAVAAILHCLHHPALAGPVNIVAPNPVRNRDFARALGRALHRPSFMPAPEFALKLLFGAEMARNTIFASQRVAPQKLSQSGFQFRWPEIGPALAAVLKANG